jgi:hypothetical protein
VSESKGFTLTNGLGRSEWGGIIVGRVEFDERTTLVANHCRDDDDTRTPQASDPARPALYQRGSQNEVKQKGVLDRVHVACVSFHVCDCVISVIV